MTATKGRCTRVHGILARCSVTKFSISCSGTGGGGGRLGVFEGREAWLRLAHLRCTELIKDPIPLAERARQGVRNAGKIQPAGAHS